MAPTRDRRFANFNFLVALAADDVTPAAGFHECSNLDGDVVVRSGNERDSSVSRVTTRSKATDITLKRGVIDSTELHAWLAALRDGAESAARTLRITLMNEDHTQAVQTWTLLGARIMKYVSGPFNAKATDIAIEELTLSYDSIETDE
jgi:phage tail-like protein